MAENDKKFFERIKKVSRKRLAKEANVTYSYLSGVINGFSNMSDTKKSQIEKALKKIETEKRKEYLRDIEREDEKKL
jgi:transcriptional regulator with XRE-family HTH domain